MSRVSTRPIAGPGHRPFPTTAETGRTLSQAIGAIATILTIDLNRVRQGSAMLRRPEDSPLAEATRAEISAGGRPCLQVNVIGFDGLHVHVFVNGVSGAIAHTRTRQRARELARPAVASMLHVDTYAFDLEIYGA
jgi:hypothetical protein